VTNTDLSQLPSPPPLSTHRRQQLEDHLRRESRGFRPSRFGRRPLVAAVAAGIVALCASTAIAASAGLGDSFFGLLDRDAERSADLPRLIGGRVELAAGSDWSFQAWRSTRGICTALVFANDEGTSGCGYPVVGAPGDSVHTQPEPTRAVVGGTYRSETTGLWISGVATAEVSRVEVTLRDGRVLKSETVTPSSSLDAPLTFFVVRTAARDSDPAPPESPLAEIRAYSASGNLVDTFVEPSVGG
jgi:hypothetical protein